MPRADAAEIRIPDLDLFPFGDRFADRRVEFIERVTAGGLRVVSSVPAPYRKEEEVKYRTDHEHMKTAVCPADIAGHDPAVIFKIFSSVCDPYRKKHICIYYISETEIHPQIRGRILYVVMSEDSKGSIMKRE